MSEQAKEPMVQRAEPVVPAKVTPVTRVIFACRYEGCGRVVAARESKWCHGVPMDRLEVAPAGMTPTDGLSS